MDKWVEMSGYVTEGGDTVWKCPICGKGKHVYGIEHLSNYTHKCSDCGALLIYPWENDNQND